MTATGKKKLGKAKSEIIRKVFRLPIFDDDDVSISIDGNSFEIINIGTGGIGILIDKEVTFSTDQQLDNIELNLEGRKLVLQGRVVHISPREFQLICGIEFVNMNEEHDEKIVTFLRKNKEHLFG